MFERRVEAEGAQEEFWVLKGELPKATPGRFYQKVEVTLQRAGFAQALWKICEPAYAQVARGGRPGIDPVVYFKMLLVGFFEDLPSERAIAARCADSLSVRGFLGYTLQEGTPDHSSLSVIRGRLSARQFGQAHELLLRMLHEHGLLRGRHLGIDSSVIEANASLRSLVERNSEEAYWEYVQKLAAEEGINAQDARAVRAFDRKRPRRRTGNDQWVNPHDPDAKVGRTKDGACDMIYKPEHVSDLESGAIVRVEARLGDAGDTQGMDERLAQAAQTLAQVKGCAPDAVARSVTADEGYFALEPIGALQAQGVRTIIGDPKKRAWAKMSEKEKMVCRRAARAVNSQSGRAWLRRRGEFLERAFCHVLDHGGLRRATLRGRENLTKRLLVAALGFNLSLLLRKTLGCGTPKQYLAGANAALSAMFASLYGFWRLLQRSVAKITPIALVATASEADSWFAPHSNVPTAVTPQIGRFSTGC